MLIKLNQASPKTLMLVRGSVIGAAYTALTLAVSPLSYGPIQVRFAEAMCILPFFFPESVWGLFVGCALANGIGVLLGLTGPWDILFGSLATLFAAYLTRRCKIKWLAPLPPVVINALVIGPMLAFMFTGTEVWQVSVPVHILQVGIGQLIACYGLGLPLLFLLVRLGFKKPAGI